MAIKKSKSSKRGNGIFARGYEVSREEKKRQDEARESSGKKLWNFYLKGDGDEADLRFLTEEPINFYEHNVMSKRNGKEVYNQYTCTGKNCSLCADGDRPTFKGAYLVVDRREYEYTDDKGKTKTGRDQVRLFVQGMKVISQLDRISNKYGLSCRDVTLIRLGTGTQTSYTIERGEKEKLSTDEIEELLPDKLKEEYDGTMDSLYKIVEDQLMLNVKDSDRDTNEDEDEDDDDYEDNDNLVSEDDEDEDEEEERPSRTTKNKGKKGLFKKPQNSLKRTCAKSLLKNNFK